MHVRRMHAIALSALLLAAGCGPSPTGPSGEQAAAEVLPGDRPLQDVVCHVNVVTQETRCSGAIATSGGAH